MVYLAIVGVPGVVFPFPELDMEDIHAYPETDTEDLVRAAAACCSRYQQECMEWAVCAVTGLPVPAYVWCSDEDDALEAGAMD